MTEQRADTTGSRMDLALTALPSDTWVVLHDIRVPGRRAAIDHVLVGPPGVFAVCTLQLHGRVREREVAEALGAARAVASVCPSVARDDVRPLLCYDTDEALDTWVHGVVVASPGTLVELVTARRSLFQPTEVRDVAAALEGLQAIAAAAPATRRPAGSHRAAIERGGMALRLVRRSGPVASQP